MRAKFAYEPVDGTHRIALIELAPSRGRTLSPNRPAGDVILGKDCGAQRQTIRPRIDLKWSPRGKTKPVEPLGLNPEAQALAVVAQRLNGDENQQRLP